MQLYDLLILIINVTPFYNIAQHIEFEEQHKSERILTNQYEAIGISFSKKYAYSKGARPVIYEDTTVSTLFIAKEQYWRLVKLKFTEHSVIDWTHEREWRINQDFEFDAGQCIIILPDKESHRKLIKVIGSDRLQNYRDIIILETLYV